VRSQSFFAMLIHAFGDCSYLPNMDWTGMCNKKEKWLADSGTTLPHFLKLMKNHHYIIAIHFCGQIILKSFLKTTRLHSEFCFSILDHPCLSKVFTNFAIITLL
jgi:hypothetical protein